MRRSCRICSAVSIVFMYEGFLKVARHLKATGLLHYYDKTMHFGRCLF